MTSLDWKGWGKIKTDFETMIARFRGEGRSVIIVAHQVEKDNGEGIVEVRPDCGAGSGGKELIKDVDMIGYIAKGVLSFNYNPRIYTKNSYSAPDVKIPQFDRATKSLFLNQVLISAIKKKYAQPAPVTAEAATPVEEAQDGNATA
jgi:hypothetical protein